VVEVCSSCLDNVAEGFRVAIPNQLIEVFGNLLVVDPLLVLVKITAHSSVSPRATLSDTTRQPPTCSSEQSILLMSCDASSARLSREHRAHTPHDPQTADACAQTTDGHGGGGGCREEKKGRKVGEKKMSRRQKTKLILLLFSDNEKNE
jgi:hypothetical protein